MKLTKSISFVNTRRFFLIITCLGVAAIGWVLSHPSKSVRAQVAEKSIVDLYGKTIQQYQMTYHDLNGHFALEIKSISKDIVNIIGDDVHFYANIDDIPLDIKNTLKTLDREPYLSKDSYRIILVAFNPVLNNRQLFEITDKEITKINDLRK